MELRDLSVDDGWLWEALQGDPVMMEKMGGPRPLDAIRKNFQSNLECARNGTCWVYKVMSDEDPEVAAGSVVIWESEHHGEAINEIGWMILSAYQGKGLASRAVRAMLDRNQLEKRWDVIHAFPPTNNPASNALCRKMGFELLGEFDFEWSGRMLHCNHWRLDTRETPI